MFKGAHSKITILTNEKIKNVISGAMGKEVNVSSTDKLVIEFSSMEISKLRGNLNSNLRLIKSVLDTIEEVK